MTEGHTWGCGPQEPDLRSAEDRAETSDEWACWIEDTNSYERFEAAWVRVQKELRVDGLTKLGMLDILSELKPTEPAI